MLVQMKHIKKYIADNYEDRLWYGRVDMNTGEKQSSVVTLYDAFFPAIMALSGDMKTAREFQETRFWLWNKYGLEPVSYDYKKGVTGYPVYDLNPEIIESAYYLYHLTIYKNFTDLNYLNTRTEAENTKYLKTETDPYKALEGAHAIAVLTEWDEFKTLDWQNIYNNMLKPAFVFDGRNLLNKKELEKIGFVYQAIGS